MSGKHDGRSRKTDPASSQSVKGFASRRAKLVSRDVVNFTPAVATDLLETTTEFSDDRPLNSRHVDYLVRTMERGTFEPELVSIVTCTLDGVEYRMNGQHTAWATVMVDRSAGEVQWLRYRATNRDAMAQLYSSIDRGKERSKSFVVQSYLGGDDRYGDLTKLVVRALSAGFAQRRWGFHTGRAHDGDEIGSLMRGESRDLCLKVGTFMDSLSTADSKLVRRGPVVAGMLATFEHRPRLAEGFWRPVCTGVGFEDIKDPRLVLRNWLSSVTVRTGAGASASGKKSVAPQVIYFTCLQMWNHWRDGKTVTNVRPPKAEPKLS